MKRRFEQYDAPCDTLQRAPQDAPQDTNAIVTLNIGGTLHSTTLHVLRNSVDYFPQSVLGRMFGAGGVAPPLRDAEGRYFIDADYEVFRHILNVLRRPSLVSDVPRHMSAEAWCRELDYWGLVPVEDVQGASTQITGGHLSPAALSALLNNGADEHDPYDSMTLAQIGAAIKHEIMDNEALVIRTLFKATGYKTLGNKTRTAVLRVPTRKYALPWGTDMGEYLLKNQKCITALMCDMLGLEHRVDSEETASPITIHESKTPKHHVNYVFDGKPYTTQESTVTVTIEFSNLPTVHAAGKL